MPAERREQASVGARHAWQLVGLVHFALFSFTVGACRVRGITHVHIF